MRHQFGPNCQNRIVNDESDNKLKTLRPEGFPDNWLAILPKKVAASIKNTSLAEVRKKLPDELAKHFKKLIKKYGKDIESDISQVFPHLAKRGPSDFSDGSIAQSLACKGFIDCAILHANPTFAATVPIAYERWNSNRSELIGSGVLIRIGNRTFLLTVAHVADFNSQGRLLIPGKDRFMSPGGLYSVMNLPPSGNRNDDKLDVAYVCLENESADNLHSDFKILDHQDLSLEEEPSRRMIYTFAGFPWRKSRSSAEAIGTVFNTMEGIEIQRHEYEALGRNRSQHIIVRFNRKRTFSDRLQRVVTAPLPNGLSGGGVYAWSEEALKNWPVRLPLVGIANTFMPDKCLLIATRLYVYFRCIFHSHPELAQKG